MNKESNFIELNWNTDLSSTVSMFENCINITEVDLSHFDASQLKTTYYMFRGCSSLTSVNLSNFVAKNLLDIEEMFKNCSSLTSLDLSNFYTSNVHWIDRLFYGCTNLEYINLKNFDESQLTAVSKYEKMFENIPSNVVICINESKNQNIIFPQIKKIECYIIDCSDDWKSKQKKIIPKTGKCLESCDKDPQYKYEYNGKCYDNCPKGYFTDENNINKCKCELEKCLICPPEALEKKLCTKCNTDFYQIEKDPLNIGNFIEC